MHKHRRNILLAQDPEVFSCVSASKIVRGFAAQGVEWFEPPLKVPASRHRVCLAKLESSSEAPQGPASVAQRRPSWRHAADKLLYK